MFDLDRLLQGVTKPARYTGSEWNSIVKDWEESEVRVALCYPDLYEVGMCNLGLSIIYELLNRQEGVLCERVFAPWVDMSEKLRTGNIPLLSLESRRALKDFDVIGFSLGYELTYTNVLNILDLAQVPVMSAVRGEHLPLIIAGGSCTLNPEPMTDFVDLFIVGEGEEVTVQLVDLFRRWKLEGSGSKSEFLLEAIRIPGVYVPRFYEAEYGSNGTLASLRATVEGAPSSIERRVVDPLPDAPTRPVVPYIEVIHDRGAVEIQRGCAQGCRFCQAGMIYRPVRERSEDEVVRAIDELVTNCGYEEISLLSLSTTDYPNIATVISTLSRRYRGQNLALSLPSLRPDSFSVALANLLQEGKKPGFTFAPEAGTERLRCVINKNLSEEEVLQAVETAWDRGWKSVKLYFMIGLPTETHEDIEGIVDLVRKVRRIGKNRINVRVNASTFVPKPHTPFQWVAQAPEGEIVERQWLLKSGLRKAGAQVSWHDPKVSLLEGAMSRGDRRLGAVILDAWAKGCRFDAWSEHFSWDSWEAAFQDHDLDPLFYASRERAPDELLPWSHIDTGIEAGFLKEEYERSKTGGQTGDCRTGPCNLCGLQRKHDVCRQRSEGRRVTTETRSQD